MKKESLDNTNFMLSNIQRKETFNSLELRAMPSDRLKVLASLYRQNDFIEDLNLVETILEKRSK